MIITETITINSIEYQRTYSDAGLIIERNGVQYSEAIDPIGIERIYIETDELLPDIELETEDMVTLQTSVDILLGGRDDELDW